MLLLALLSLAGCAGQQTARPAVQARLSELATSQQQWSGIAVSRQGRVFVSYPRRSGSWHPSVAELLPSGQVRPYPGGTWNTRPSDPAVRPVNYFISVQGLCVDPADFLWVLDGANPGSTGVVAGGPKLVRVDLRSNRVLQVIEIPAEVALPASYLLDLRVDLRTGTAFISDSGLGAIVVVDLAAGTSRRLLDGHPSVTSEGKVINVGGKAWRLPDGSLPEVHLSGLALTPDSQYLYYQVLTGRSLYRVPTAVLRNPELSEAEVDGAVQLVGQTCVADALLFAADGMLYLTDVEHGAIRRLNRRGELEVVIADPRLSWPDRLAIDNDGALYFTTSQRHQPPGSGPYRLFRLEIRG